MKTQARSQEQGYARTPDDGREEIVRWEGAQPTNYYLADDHLRMILEACWGGDGLERHRLQLEKFGGEAATVVDAAIRRANEVENLPRLSRYSPVGERIEDVVHSLDHHTAGRYIYGSGAMSVYSEPGNNLLALTLFYLSSQNGEAGHNCPLACTARRNQDSRTSGKPGAQREVSSSIARSRLRDSISWSAVPDGDSGRIGCWRECLHSDAPGIRRRTMADQRRKMVLFKCDRGPGACDGAA